MFFEYPAICQQSLATLPVLHASLRVQSVHRPAPQRLRVLSFYHVTSLVRYRQSIAIHRPPKRKFLIKYLSKIIPYKNLARVPSCSLLSTLTAPFLTRTLVPRLFFSSALVHLNSPPLLVSPVAMSGSSESTPSLHLSFFFSFYFTLTLFLHRFLPSLVPFLRVIPRAPLLCLPTL